MQVDGVFSLPAGDEDDGSLFGSPPPSPARGRSPQLALPAGPGSAENVGTIALPGSHPCSELAIDPAVLLLNRPLPTRKPDTPTPPTTTPTPTSTINPLSSPPTSCSSPQRPSISRGPSRAPKNSKKGKERSTTPHPPPPIHFPDPNEPLPSNFLRSQQALLGHAGLIGGLDPSALSTRYHKGATSRNPIIVEDELNPPPLGKKGTYSLGSSSLPSPSSQEVVSSLIKQKNIFPVLESLVRLLSGTGVPSASPAAVRSRSPLSSSSTGTSNERGTVPKRRRLNSVPAGAVDWDVPYPFQQGEGPSQYRVRWEKERLKRLLSQLVVLIEGARRSAAARTYFQQYSDPCSPANPAEPPDQMSFQRRPTDDISLSEQQDTPAFTYGAEDVASTPTIISPPPLSQTSGAPPQTASLDNLITSLYNSIPSLSSPSNLTSFSPSPTFSPHPHPSAGAHADALDAFPPDLEQLLAALHHCPSPCVELSADSPGVEASPAPSANHADQFPPHRTFAVPSTIPDSLIDPMLLGRSFNSGPDLVDPSQSSTDGQGPSTPTLLQSPVASTSSLFDPLTPREDFSVEPDIHRPEQAEDPINAAALLLQIVSSAPSPTAAQPKPQLLPLPASRSLSMEPQSPVPALYSQPFATSTATTTPILSRASSTVPIHGPTASAIAPTAQILSLLDRRRRSQAPLGKKPLNKQEIMQRAKDRRQQLLTELEKAKVELWEATIEQGVLSHLMKDSSCL